MGGHYLARVISRGGEMGKRGPKPVEMGKLNFWEFEWYKALHLLRDGAQLRPHPAFETVNRRDAMAQLEWWKKARPEEILGDMRRINPPPFNELATTDERARAKREWVTQERRSLGDFAELERQGEISALERQLKPKKIYACAERREIWDELIRAQTVPALRKACQRWESLADVRAKGFTCFAAHVSTNPDEFLRMKRNRRFPRSSYADESRLEYLARGMAGVLMGVSPMTAIERLRNMKHEAGGPMWHATAKACTCWRCQNCRWRKYYEETARQIEEGANQ